MECSERVQRHSGLFELSRSLHVAVLDCSARYIDLRTARWRSDLATHTRHPMADCIGGSSQVSTVECSEHMQRYSGLFEVSRSLSVAVPNCSTRYTDLRTAR